MFVHKNYKDQHCQPSETDFCLILHGVTPAIMRQNVIINRAKLLLLILLKNIEGVTQKIDFRPLWTNGIK